MHVSRNFSSLLILAVSGVLTACATAPGQELGTGPVGPALTQTPVVVQAAPAAAVAAPVPEQAASEAASAAPKSASGGLESVIIRGDDNTFKAKPNTGPMTGPLSSFKFENAPSGEVVHVMLRDLLKVDYVVHPPLNGNITLTTRGEVDADKALLLLETALQVNGVLMAQDSRGTYHVGSPEALKHILAAPRLADSKAMAPGFGAVIIAPQYLGANEVANILRPMVPPDAIVRVDSLRNILVMRGTRAEAEGWLDIVNTFDVNLLRGMSVGVFPLKHSSVADVQSALQLLAGGAAEANGQQAAGAAARVAPQAARQQGGSPQQMAAAAAAAGGMSENNPLFGALRILPIERINAIMVVTPRSAYLDEMRYWIEQFDRPNLNSAEPQLFVYKVLNGSAQHLSELLNGIYGGGTEGRPAATGVAPGLGGTTAARSGMTNGVNNLSRYSGNQGNQRSLLSGSRSGSQVGSGLNRGGIGGNVGGVVAASGTGTNGATMTTMTLGESVRVMADHINNSLLIHATPAEFTRIEATMKRLDVPRAQVLIEASIVEVTLRDELEYGARWNFSGGVGGGYAGTGGVRTGAGALDDFSGNLNGFTYALRNSMGNIKAQLVAESSKGNMRLLSSPSLMVLDNHTASISVGDQIPVRSGTNYGTSGGDNNIITSNYEFKDTGVILQLTPQVNGGDLVTLEIDQEVTNVDESSSSGDGLYRFKQRTMSSKVAVRSGETIVLGGLIRQNDSKGNSGVPVLSSIPVVGGLFGTQRKSEERIELLMVLTPRVVRSDEDARAISSELRDRMRGIADWTMPTTTQSKQPQPLITSPQEGKQ